MNNKKRPTPRKKAVPANHTRRLAEFMEWLESVRTGGMSDRTLITLMAEAFVRRSSEDAQIAFIQDLTDSGR